MYSSRHLSEIFSISTTEHATPGVQIRCSPDRVISQIIQESQKNFTVKCTNGHFLTVNRSMFTKVEVVNQWNCRAHNNLCPYKEQTCEQLNRE